MHVMMIHDRPRPSSDLHFASDLAGLCGAVSIMTAFFLKAFTSRYFARVKWIPAARWKGSRIHYPFMGTISPTLVFTLSATPRSGLVRQQSRVLITLSRGSFVTTPLASHASGQLGPANRSIPFAFAPLGLGILFARHHPESPCSGWSLAPPPTYVRNQHRDLPFHPKFPTPLLCRSSTFLYCFFVNDG
ncbi:hypothetical protein F5148DRAFT_225410 [Russula earlei]|uniref:Uncharacterized protein n=1 Tax=Russula earlei TaxID=71964 RepID=A0ACC0UJH5_9AGAM|nr:hypothetical protein F5148DRAFT_225410 [Russula earlei]